MKKFWLVLLSLGLIMAFSVSAFAVDVKVSGEYYAAGMYLNKTGLADNLTYLDAAYNPAGKLVPGRSYYYPEGAKPSTAFYFQRLRVGTDFIVSPCLKLVTRFDAMERIWGGQRSTPGTTADTGSAATRAENENIAFDYAYVDYVSPIGTFDIGYSSFGATGTIFANSSTAVGSIKYKYDFTKVPASLMLGISKVKDSSASAVNPQSATDVDQDYYGIEGVYNFKNDKASGKAGMKIAYYRYADTRPSEDYKKAYFQFTPYAIATIGPVNIQAELNWGTGNTIKYDDATLGNDVTLDQLNAFIDATANFGMFYAGGSFAYISGDDPNTTDKDEGSANNGGIDWNPCLLLFNNDVTYWAGNVSGYDSSVVNGTMKNAWFFQGRVGVKPTPQLDIMLSVSHAIVDKKPKITYPWLHDSAPGYTTDFAGGTYGTEIDIIATYKITNNLSYMLGIGYLFTGDYFKGSDDGQPIGHFSEFYDGEIPPLPNDINNDFIIVNKLILTF